jgi:putative redox protein
LATACRLLFLTADQKGPVVVVCHGFTGTKEGHGRAVDMAGEFVRHNLNCLLFDFNGCGESEGKFEDITLSGQISDLTGAVDYVLDRGLVRLSPWAAAWGHHRHLPAAADSRVKAVCSCSAPVSLTTLFPKLIYGDIPEDDSDRIRLSGRKGPLI